jgi:hypothetical protein
VDLVSMAGPLMRLGLDPLLESGGGLDFN